MINKRKQELEKYLKEIRTCSYSMSRALQRDSEDAEKMSLELMQSSMKVIIALHKELQRLRGG